jgi:hypothetical protein
VRIRPEQKTRRSPGPETPSVVLSLDPDVDAMAHELAGSNDFSPFVNEALRRDIQRT